MVFWPACMRWPASWAWSPRWARIDPKLALFMIYARVAWQGLRVAHKE